MNVSKEQAEEIARFLNEGFTEEDNDFLEAEVEVAQGKGTPQQVALVQEKLEKEPWRQDYFNALKESTQLFSPAAAEAQLNRVSKILGEDFRAALETRRPRPEPALTEAFQGIAKGVETVGGWIRREADIWTAGFNLQGLELAFNQGTPAAKLEDVALCENLVGSVAGDEIILAWNCGSELPSIGVATLSIGDTEFSSKIKSDGLGGGYVSLPKREVAEASKVHDRAEIIIKSEDAV